MGLDLSTNLWKVFKLLLFVIAIVAARQLIVIVYNLYLHPLRRFPGPFKHRVSRLAWSYLHANGLQALRTQQLHDEYGSVVRIGPNHLSFTDAQAWRDIYAHRPGGAEMPKCTIFSRPVRGPPTSVLNADKEEHTQFRRALLQGFSDSSMRQQEPVISKHIHLLLSRLREESGHDEGLRKSQNVGMWYNFLTFDLTSDLIFGESFHCLETADYHPWIANIMKAIKTHSVLLALIYSGFGFLVQAISDFGALFAISKINDYTNSMLKSRLSLGKGRNDLFEGLARKQEEWNLSFVCNDLSSRLHLQVHLKANMRQEKLSRNAMVMLLAGSETTSTTLSGATYFMLSNPQVHQLLKKEIREAFSSPDEININTVSQLTYLSAVIHETLRCYPPLTSNLVRVVPTGGAEIAGHFIPEGTLVEVQPWSVNHSEQNWADPWVFRPERFMASNSETLDNSAHMDKLESSQAFGVGPRNCLGRNLAYSEMRLTLANIIYNFDLELDESSKGWAECQRAFNVWDRGALNVVFTPVKGP